VSHPPEYFLRQLHGNSNRAVNTGIESRRLSEAEEERCEARGSGRGKKTLRKCVLYTSDNELDVMFVRRMGLSWSIKHCPSGVVSRFCHEVIRSYRDNQWWRIPRDFR
jgi:hypothetical protein